MGTRRRVQPVPDRRSKVAAGRLRGTRRRRPGVGAVDELVRRALERKPLWSRQRQPRYQRPEPLRAMAGAWNSTRSGVPPSLVAGAGGNWFKPITRTRKPAVTRSTGRSLPAPDDRLISPDGLRRIPVERRSGFDGDRSDDELALGIPLGLRLGKHRILEVYDPLLEKIKER